MGKSTAAKMLARMGYAHFDADAVVHGLTGPGGKALPAIARFAPEAVSAEHGMDRKVGHWTTHKGGTLLLQPSNTTLPESLQQLQQRNTVSRSFNDENGRSEQSRGHVL